MKAKETSAGSDVGQDLAEDDPHVAGARASATPSRSRGRPTPSSGPGRRGRSPGWRGSTGRSSTQNVCLVGDDVAGRGEERRPASAARTRPGMASRMLSTAPIARVEARAGRSRRSGRRRRRREADDGRHRGHDQRAAGAVDRAAEHVVADVVGAEPVLRRRARRGRRRGTSPFGSFSGSRSAKTRRSTSSTSHTTEAQNKKPELALAVGALLGSTRGVGRDAGLGLGFDDIKHGHGAPLDRGRRTAGRRGS